MDNINENTTTEDITLENIGLIPNLRHEHYHEQVHREIYEGLLRKIKREYEGNFRLLVESIIDE